MGEISRLLVVAYRVPDVHEIVLSIARNQPIDDTKFTLHQIVLWKALRRAFERHSGLGRRWISCSLDASVVKCLSKATRMHDDALSSCIV